MAPSMTQGTIACGRYPTPLVSPLPTSTYPNIPTRPAHKYPSLRATAFLGPR